MEESTSLVLHDPHHSDAEVVTLAASAGYGGRTREGYALDLRQYLAWCTEHRLRLFGVHRTDIELYARGLEARGRARARNESSVGIVPTPQRGELAAFARF